MVSILATHVDAHALPFERLADYVPPPGTRSWSPIAHADFAKVVRETIDSHGYGIAKEQYTVTKNGAQMFGVFDLSFDGMTIVPEEVALVIGIRNSVDKSIAGTILAGERVFVSFTLAFSSKIVEIRKHTRFFVRDFAAKVDDAIVRCSEHGYRVCDKVRRLRALTCSDQMACGIIIDAAQAGACQWRDIPKVLKAWRDPSHAEFQDRNGWSLYNAFTEVAKARFDSHPQQAVVASLKLNRLEPFAEVNG